MKTFKEILSSLNGLIIPLAAHHFKVSIGSLPDALKDGEPLFSQQVETVDIDFTKKIIVLKMADDIYHTSAQILEGIGDNTFTLSVDQFSREGATVRNREFNGVKITSLKYGPLDHGQGGTVNYVVVLSYAGYNMTYN